MAIAIAGKADIVGVLVPVASIAAVVVEAVEFASAVAVAEVVAEAVAIGPEGNIEESIEVA